MLARVSPLVSKMRPMPLFSLSVWYTAVALELAGMRRSLRGGSSGFWRAFLFLAALYSFILALYSSRSAMLRLRSWLWMGSMRLRHRVRRPLPEEARAVMKVKRFGRTVRRS